MENENMSMFDANLLIYKTLWEIEKRDLSGSLGTYEDLVNWFVCQTGEKYTISNLIEKIKADNDFLKEWEENREKEIDQAFDRMVDFDFEIFRKDRTKKELSEIFNDEKIKRINKALGYELTDWQIDFIRGSEVFGSNTRGSGRNMAFIVKKLFESDEPLDMKKTKIIGNEINFKRDLKEIYFKLNLNGVRTRSVIF